MLCSHLGNAYSILEEYILEIKKMHVIVEIWPVDISSVNGRFRVETTEVRRVHVHSSLLVVTSNQNASNKKKIA